MKSYFHEYRQLSVLQQTLVVRVPMRSLPSGRVPIRLPLSGRGAIAIESTNSTLEFTPKVVLSNGDMLIIILQFG